MRRVPFDGAVNFRDLGGHPAGPGRRTRWNTVYRSDSLAELTEADLARLAELDLYGLIDFRLPTEAAKKPNRLPHGHAIRLANPGYLPEKGELMLDRVRAATISTDDLRTEMIQHYAWYVERHLSNYTDLFRTILDANGQPVLLHCTSGKDRTGFGSALVLLAAGCDDETIIEDFLLTNDFRRDLTFMLSEKATPESIDLLTSVERIFMTTSLDTLRWLHGTGDDWLGEVGVAPTERATLRTLLTEPAG